MSNVICPSWCSRLPIFQPCSLTTRVSLGMLSSHGLHGGFARGTILWDSMSSGKLMCIVVMIYLSIKLVMSLSFRRAEKDRDLYMCVSMEIGK